MASAKGSEASHAIEFFDSLCVGVDEITSISNRVRIACKATTSSLPESQTAAIAPLDDFGRQNLGALNIEFRAEGDWQAA